MGIGVAIQALISHNYSIAAGQPGADCDPDVSDLLNARKRK